MPLLFNIIAGCGFVVAIVGIGTGVYPLCQRWSLRHASGYDRVPFVNARDGLILSAVLFLVCALYGWQAHRVADQQTARQADRSKVVVEMARVLDGVHVDPWDPVVAAEQVDRAFAGFRMPGYKLRTEVRHDPFSGDELSVTVTSDGIDTDACIEGRMVSDGRHAVEDVSTYPLDLRKISQAQCGYIPISVPPLPPPPGKLERDLGQDSATDR